MALYRAFNELDARPTILFQVFRFPMDFTEFQILGDPGHGGRKKLRSNLSSFKRLFYKTAGDGSIDDSIDGSFIL